MTILHIIENINNQFLTEYVKFINRNFVPSDHIFMSNIPIAEITFDLKIYNNIIYIPKEKIIKEIAKYDKVICHYLSFKTKEMIFLLLRPVILHKIIWVAWGADLYEWKKEAKNLKDIFYNYIQFVFRKNLKNFVGIFPPDINEYQRIFQSTAKTFYAHYAGLLYSDYTNYSYGKIHYSNFDRCFNILVGHRSVPILNHISVLDTLYKFKTENFKIYVPLSYGDMEYGDKVEEYAKKLFGSKAICLRKKMSKNDYIFFLSNIDIAIFNTTRQIGLGNIHPLLYYGKKIFFPDNTIMYKYFISKNIEVADYNKIQDMCYKEFTELVRPENGINYVNKLGDEKELVKLWSNVFNTAVYKGTVKNGEHH